MAFRMLISPRHTQELGPVVLHEQRSRDFRVTWKAERQHLRGIADARFPVMDGNRALAALNRVSSGYL
jgi:hypothetical protein